jgi:hypothetical protein
MVSFPDMRQPTALLRIYNQQCNQSHAKFFWPT